MLLLIPSAVAVPIESGADLPLVHAPTEERRYDKLVEIGDGRVEGRTRKRTGGNYLLWELPTGTVVRYWKLAGGVPAEDHLFDAAGFPLATVTYQGATAKKVAIPGHPPREVPLDGWTLQTVPGGTVWLPGRVGERPGGGLRVDALDGRVDVWLEQKTDPLGDSFRDGLLSGCGCFVIDRAAAWIDGRLGVRYRLLLPGNTPRDAVDLWAVELPQGTFVLTYTVSAPEDPVAALRIGRALVAGVDLKPSASPGGR